MNGGAHAWQERGVIAKLAEPYSEPGLILIHDGPETVSAPVDVQPLQPEHENAADPPRIVPCASALWIVSETTREGRIDGGPA